MTGQASLLQFALLGGFVLAIALTLLSALAQPILRRQVSGRTAEQRVRIFWWTLATPALAGVLYAAVVLAVPSLFGQSPSLAAACSAHADNLIHMCVWHPSSTGYSPWLWGLLSLLATYVAWLAVRATLGLWRARQLLATMLRLSDRSEHASRLHVLPVDRPLAVAFGIGEGHVLLSSSLLRQLSPTQLRVVLAHENAHIAHRDVLCRLIAAMLSIIHLPGIRHRLLEDLDLALEQRCDQAAAMTVGCPVTVAETIVAMEKIFRGHTEKEPLPLAMAFLSDFVPERIEALLSPPRRSFPFLGLLLASAVVVFCSLSTGWLHSVTESLISRMNW